MPLRDYCAGLLTTEGRKSVEPMAAVTAPAQVSVQHQKLLHFVGEGKWSDESVLAKVRELVLPGIERHGPIKAWIIDDTSYPKQGTHSVGVNHQYCGRQGHGVVTIQKIKLNQYVMQQHRTLVSSQKPELGTLWEARTCAHLRLMSGEPACQARSSPLLSSAVRPVSSVPRVALSGNRTHGDRCRFRTPWLITKSVT
jgi:hypothetical protein